MRHLTEMSVEELARTRALQPKVQVFQAFVGVACLVAAIVMWIAFNFWSSIGLFFASICQPIIMGLRKRYIDALNEEIIRRG